ncbi:MAG: GAF domain-containing protein [Pseudolabrys sp.]
MKGSPRGCLVCRTKSQSWTIWRSGCVNIWTLAIMDHLAEWMRQHLDARFASAQLYDPKLKRLRVVAQREFASGLLDQFGEMSITSGTICARAARVQLPILISDVTTDEDWVPFLSFSESAGFGGVLSIPLLSRAGALIGVTSCHFAGRAKPSGSEMKFAQASCEFASDAILEIRRVNGNRPA